MNAPDRKKKKTETKNGIVGSFLKSCRRLSDKVIPFYEKERDGCRLVSDRLVFLAAGQYTGQSNGVDRTPEAGGRSGR